MKITVFKLYIYNLFVKSFKYILIFINLKSYNNY